jgi:hypothetical protein
MSIQVAERWNSRRWQGGDTPAVELEFVITGTDDDAAALAVVLGTAPAYYANLPRKGRPQLERIGDQAWQAVVRYGGLESQDFGLISVEFEVGSQTTKIMQSLATVGVYPAPDRTAPNYYGAINVTRDGVEGVDIEIPTYEWTETWRHPDGTVGPSYGAVLYAVTGRVNSAAFRGFAAGEVLFRGATGRKTRQDAWEITYRFAASPNATGLTIGPITGIEKKGWEYLWVVYEDFEDNTAMKLVKRPLAAYVEQVYPSTDFAVLGIGN